MLMELSAADAISAVLAVNGCYKYCLFLLPIIQLVKGFLSRALAVNNASSSCHVWNLQNTASSRKTFALDGASITC